MFPSTRRRHRTTSSGGVPTNTTLTAAQGSYALSGQDATLTKAAGSSFLIDNLSSAPWAAWSTRKLRSAYAGSAIKVRRSSDNTTQDIGFDGNGELDTSALATFVSSNSGYIDTWYDQSGNGYDLTASATGNQPQIVNSGTNRAIGGKPAVYFNASVWLRTATNKNLTNGISVGGVVSTDGGGGTIVSAGTSRPQMRIVGAGTLVMNWLKSQVTDLGSSSTVMASSADHQIYTYCDGSGAAYYLDGAADGTGSTSTSFSSQTTWAIGSQTTASANEGYLGRMGEILLFDTSGSISSGDRSTMASSQKTYWGTP